MGKQLKDDPLGLRAQLSNGNDEAVSEEEVTEPDPLGLRAALKKKDHTESAQPSAADSKELASGESGQLGEMGAKVLQKPSLNPINDLQTKIELAQKEHLETVKNTELPEVPGLKPLEDIKLGQPGKGIGKLAGDILNKDKIGRKEATDFLVNQQLKFNESISKVPDELAISKQDVTSPTTNGPLSQTELASNKQQVQDQAAAEKRTEEDNGVGRVGSFAGKFDQTVVNAFADILKSEAILASETIGRLGFGNKFGEAPDPTKDPVYKLADWAERQTKEMFADNPKFQGEVFTDTVPQVAGTLLSFFIGGALGKTSKVADLAIPSATKAIMQETAQHVPAAFMASAGTAAEEYEKALEKTGDKETAMRTWEKNMFTGVPFLVNPTFKAFDKATDGALKYGIKKFAEGGIAGGFQMGASHALENLSAQQTYDKSREILDGVMATGGSGFAINGLLTGLFSAISHKAIGASPTEKAKYEEAINYVQEQQKNTADLGNTDYVKQGPEFNIKAPEGNLGKAPTDVVTEKRAAVADTSDKVNIENAADQIQKKVNETPEEGVINDRKNDRGLSGEVGEGQKLVQTEPVSGGSSQETGGSGILQNTPGGSEAAPEVTNENPPKQFGETGGSAAPTETAKTEETLPVQADQEVKGEVKTSPEGTQPVFVYGTLKDATTRKEALGEEVSTEKAKALGEEKQSGEYSTIEPSTDKNVEGEVMQLSADQIKKLDSWESDYERKEITLEDGTKAWAYSRKPEINAEGKPAVQQPLPSKDQPVDKGNGPPAETTQPEPSNEAEDLSGIKKALVPEEKVADMENKLEQRTDEEFMVQAKKDVESGDINPNAIINEVLSKHRALQTHEVAALVYHKAKIDNRLNALNVLVAKIKAEGGNAEQMAYYNKELELLNEERDKFHEMQLITAREQGRAFGLRKMLLDNEFNLQSQVNQYKAVSADGEIPPEVLKHFQDIDEKLKKANAWIEELEKSADARQEKRSMDNIGEEVHKERKKANRPKRGKDLISEGVDELAQALGVTKMAIGGVKADPVKALEKIGRGLIDEGLATLENLGQKLKEYLEEKFKGKIKFEDYEKEVIGNIQASMPRPTVEDGKLRIPKSVIHDLVESGIDNIEDLTKAIHEMVKKDNPKITERQVRDTITEYGKTVSLSKDKIDAKIRELKRIGTKLSQLEDVKKQLRPLRSGLQRDKPTDRERELEREIKEGMKDLPEDAGETERVWKTAIESTKTRLKNQITDLEDQIKTGKKTPKKKGIEYDAEAKSLVAKRDQLREQLEAIEGKPEMSDEQRLRQAVANADRTLKNYERRVKEGDFNKKEKKAPVTGPELEKIRKQRDVAKEQYEKIKEELGIAENQRLQKAKESVRKSIADYERRVKEGDFSKREKAKVTSTDSELEKALIEREKAKFEYEVAQEKNRIKNRPTEEKVKDVLLDVANIPKAIWSSLDLSAILRQGLFAVAHPTSIPKSLKIMFRAMRSQKYYENWLMKIKSSDAYPMMKASKLYIEEANAKLSAREEGFASKLLGKIPKWLIVGELYKVSNRAYSSYLNALRVDIFAKGSDQLLDQGYTMQNNPQAFKDWANFVNQASGRGNLGKLERAASVLNVALFSPRFIASRFNVLGLSDVATLGHGFYGKMDPKVRKMAIGDTVKMISFGLTILALAKAAGADVETDPTSSDFGKIKIGDTRYDLWGGYQQQVVLFSRLIAGSIKKASGDVEKLNSDKWGARDRMDIIGNFMRSKESPIASIGHNLITGKNMIGEKVTPLTELKRSVQPLLVQDITEMYKNEGISGVAKIAVPALLGIGVQSYKSKPKSYKQIIREMLQDTKIEGIPKSSDVNKLIEEKQ